MSPTLMGRLQTRVFLAATVGVLWTAAITPALPRPAGMSLAFTYHVTFEALGLMTLLGLGWEVVYHALQQTRWDKDWPSVFALLAVVVEAIPLWYVTHILGVIPGTTSQSSPMLPMYALLVGSTWLLTWLVMQGPLRVVLVRWRFGGGKVLVWAPGRLRRRSSWPNTAADGTAQAAAADTEGAGATAGTAVAAGTAAAGEPGTLVGGVVCGKGHFSHPDARYCAVCGSAVFPLTGPSQVGRRPPAGILILADGRTTVLDHDLTVTTSGPGGDLGFLPAGEHPRAVAHIKLVGWQPVVTSLVGAMSLLLPGGSSLRMEPNVPAPLVPGTELALGDHRLRYESPHGGWYPGLAPGETVGSPGPVVAGEAEQGGAVMRRRRVAAPLAVAAGAGTLSGAAARPARRSWWAAAAVAATAALVAAVMAGLSGPVTGRPGSAGSPPAALAPAPASGPATPGTQPSQAGKPGAGNGPGSGASSGGPWLTSSPPARTPGRSPSPGPTSTPGQPSTPPPSPSPAPSPTTSPPSTPSPSPAPTTPIPTPTPTRTRRPGSGSCTLKISLAGVTLRVCLLPIRSEL